MGQDLKASGSQRGESKIAAFYNKWRPGGAHNGYLDIYLNLGLIGLSLLIGLFIATFWKIRLELFRNFEWGRYRLGFLVAVVLRGWTEAASHRMVLSGLFSISLLWTIHELTS